MPLGPITLDRSAATPLAVQLADAVRAAVADGLLRVGDRLPSTRALATELGVSRTVTAAAYDHLHAEGWIGGKHGSGTYVTTTPPRELRPAPRPDHSPDDGTYIDLVPGAPLIESLNRAAWRRAWRAAADQTPPLRPVPAGLPDYRACVAEHLLRHRGLSMAPSRIADSVLATAGITAALNELACAAFRPGDVIAVEDPGYALAVRVLRAAGLRVVPVPVDVEGVRVEEIPRDVRAVYCSPAPVPAGRADGGGAPGRPGGAGAGRWVAGHRGHYDGELRYDVAPLPLLASLAPDVVVHLGTTSKIFTSALAAGWIIAPPAVSAAVLDHRTRTGVAPPAVGQQVFVQLARSGDLGRHLRRIRKALQQRRALVVQTLAAAGFDVLGDDAGAHVVVPLDDAGQETAVRNTLAAQGIRVEHLADSQIGPRRWFGIALGYTACSTAQLDQAIPLVAAALRRHAG